MTLAVLATAACNEARPPIGYMRPLHLLDQRVISDFTARTAVPVIDRIVDTADEELVRLQYSRWGRYDVFVVPLERLPEVRSKGLAYPIPVDKLDCFRQLPQQLLGPVLSGSTVVAVPIAWDHLVEYYRRSLPPTPPAAPFPAPRTAVPGGVVGAVLAHWASGRQDGIPDAREYQRFAMGLRQRGGAFYATPGEMLQDLDIRTVDRALGWNRYHRGFTGVLASEYGIRLNPPFTAACMDVACIARNSSHKDSAIALLNQLLQPDAQRRIFERALMLPVRRDVLKALVAEGHAAARDAHEALTALRFIPYVPRPWEFAEISAQ